MKGKIMCCSLFYKGANILFILLTKANMSVTENTVRLGLPLLPISFFCQEILIENL